MVKFVRQAEATECGLAALCMVANHHGHRFDLAGLRQRFGVSMQGSSLRDIMTNADRLGLATRALRCEVEGLRDVQLPAILHWNLNHFVVLVKAGRKRFTIFDPGHGERVLTTDEVGDHFTGVVLEVTRTAEFTPVDERVAPKARLSDLWSSATGLKRSMLQVIGFSILLQVFTLAAPFYLQLTIDEAVTRFDPGLLPLLAVGFGLLYLANAATEALRGWVILILGQSLTFQMTANVLRHLIRLPSDYFEKRHVGDVISRVGSVQPIQQALTQSVVAAVIDGVMAITTAILIAVYAWQLALVVFGLTALYGLISFGLFPLLRKREERMISETAREQTYTIESIRANRAVKLFGREAERDASWRNLYSDVVNANLAASKLRLVNDFANSALLGLQLVLVVYLGARAILAGDLTIGMLIAFLAYRQNFADRVTGLVQKGIEFRMLGLHLERLSDIVHEEQETGLPGMGEAPTKLEGAFQLRDLTFAYGENGPPILAGLNLDIAPGEYVALTGPSGGGKTTLMKLMLGLLAPSSGDMLVDKRKLSEFGLRSFRSQVGVVMQDDSLLSGTIADNISFFDPNADQSRIEAAATAAQIRADVERMPMRYLSMIGDMGAALSGGQRQRLLIARALYHEPSVLFLDEGTANLDASSERLIGQLIGKMNITRIVVAHRPELIRRADRVIRIDEASLFDVTTANQQPSKDLEVRY